MGIPVLAPGSYTVIRPPRGAPLRQCANPPMCHCADVPVRRYGVRICVCSFRFSIFPFVHSPIFSFSNNPIFPLFPLAPHALRNDSIAQLPVRIPHTPALDPW